MAWPGGGCSCWEVQLDADEAGETVQIKPENLDPLAERECSDDSDDLGESVFVAIESGHPSACLLPDVYHIYKGGSDFSGLKMLGPQAVHVFHMNDYPADPPRETINDRDRVFPGDGVAPLTDILQLMHSVGFAGVLSLELFNPKYWEQDAIEVAQTGLRKMQDAVATAFSS